MLPGAGSWSSLSSSVFGYLFSRSFVRLEFDALAYMAASASALHQNCAWLAVMPLIQTHSTDLDDCVWQEMIWPGTIKHEISLPSSSFTQTPVPSWFDVQYAKKQSMILADAQWCESIKGIPKRLIASLGRRLLSSRLLFVAWWVFVTVDVRWS